MSGTGAFDCKIFTCGAYGYETFGAAKIELSYSPQLKLKMDYQYLYQSSPSIHKATLLILDDDHDTRALLKANIGVRINDLDIQTSSNLEDGMRLMSNYEPNVVILDLSLGGDAGIEGGYNFLRNIAHHRLSTRVIVLTGHYDDRYGIKALQLGAASFLTKPANMEHLTALIKDGIRTSQLLSYEATREKENREREREDKECRERLALIQIQQDLSTISATSKRLAEQIRFHAKTRQALLISGPTGTGKTMLARYIHKLAGGKPEKFIKFIPSARQSDLAISELFGHTKGAFTGANSARQGLLKLADGGTLFLDEVDELAPEVQVALLGALQDRRFRAVGSDHEQTSDFRLIAATNCDIKAAISGGKLRADLYHRLARAQIHLLSLKERIGDIADISAQILINLSQAHNLPSVILDEPTLALLMSYDWPGNIRELENVLETALYRAAFNQRLYIMPDDIDLPCPPSPKSEVKICSTYNFNDRLQDFKEQIVAEALRQNYGNQQKTAAALGIDRGTLRRIIAPKGVG